MFAFRKQGTSWVSEDINAGLVCPGADLDVEGGRIMTIAGVFSPQFNYAAMVWEYSGAAWEPQATLDFPDPSGALVPSIKAVGNRILVGSPSTNNGATGSGLAILFSEVNGTWGEAARLTPPAPTQNEYFGYSVAMNADAAAVSTSSGASGYLFDISDCDGDGFPDDCPDGCDDPQACADCNNNGTRDGCDVDCDGNGTPDDCECVALAMHTGIVPGCCNNRFIETVLPDSCQRSAARVKMMSLHHPMPPGINPSPDFSAFEYGAGCVEGPAGCVRWAGPPSTYVDSVSASTLFTASMLGCAPEYHDWGGNILLAMTGAEVAPSSVYEVQFLDEGCDPSVESNYTSPQTVETDRWGDVEFPHQDPSASDPDQPNVLDLAAIVDKVKDLPLTIPRVKAELSPQLINLNLPANAVDIGAGVDSVKGAAYPFAGPAICAN
jgi:hypothetical protein